MPAELMPARCVILTIASGCIKYENVYGKQLISTVHRCYAKANFSARTSSAMITTTAYKLKARSSKSIRAL